MKINLDVDEMYPVYYISRDIYYPNRLLDLPIEKIEEIEKVFTKFYETQEELRELWDVNKL